jgi:hypothetical protein
MYKNFTFLLEVEQIFMTTNIEQTSLRISSGIGIVLKKVFQQKNKQVF